MVVTHLALDKYDKENAFRRHINVISIGQGPGLIPEDVVHEIPESDQTSYNSPHLTLEAIVHMLRDNGISTMLIETILTKFTDEDISDEELARQLGISYQSYRTRLWRIHGEMRSKKSTYDVIMGNLALN